MIATAQQWLEVATKNLLTARTVTTIFPNLLQPHYQKFATEVGCLACWQAIASSKTVSANQWVP